MRDDPKSLHAEAARLMQARRFTEAEPILQKLTAQNPRDHEAFYRYGLLAQATHRLALSAQMFSSAAQLKPSNPEYQLQLAQMFFATGDFAAATVAAERAQRLVSSSPWPLLVLGSVQSAQKNQDAAIAHYQTALRFDPKNAPVLSNLALAYRACGRTAEAIDTARRALAVNPQSAAAHNTLATALSDFGQLEQAIPEFAAVISLDPRNVAAYNNYYLALNRDHRPTPHEVFESHRVFGQRFEPLFAAGIKPHTNDRNPDRQLRIAYLSADFREHSVRYFIEPVLAAHDRKGFHVTCYSLVFQPDAITARLRSLADAWHDVANTTDDALADQIRADGIDILIDLAGQTSKRILVLARKPAPIQITWLGYPNTTGLTTIDYRLTDAYADPPGQTDAFHTERLVRLPETFLCYRPPEDAPQCAAPPCAANHFVTFGSFNNFAKITAPTLGMWAQILAAVPDSRLLIKALAFRDSAAQQTFFTRLQSHGISPARVDLLPQQPTVAEHLAAYSKIDIALDTFPYHGTTTTCEALYMGVPVITLAGQSHVSRVGVSLLSNLGAKDWIASTPEEYIAIATRLAGDREKLTELRESLRGRLLHSALCDAPRFTANLGATYRAVWHDWCMATHLAP